MCNLVICALCFLAGTVVGVMLMCLLQSSRRMDEDFEDWSIYELQQRTELVQEFDRLADDIVVEALYIAQNHSLEERTVYIPTTELVLV